ncbi:MAG: DUF1049 domain-containing protein [Gammaproteobacteria bacterium]|nr:DUF1049 domain-containing protein [Gammaproteobacteria bacterium]
MRFVYIALVILFTILVVSLMVLNLQTVTLSLYATSVTTPLSFLVLAVYVLGMLTGGFVVSLVRTWVRRATHR